MSDTANDFVYTIQFGPDAKRSRNIFRFIAQNTLAKNVDQAAGVLSAIPNISSVEGIDLQAPLKPNELMWLIYADTLLAGLATELARDTSSDNFSIQSLIDAVPDFPAWSKFVEDILGRASGNIHMSEMNRRSIQAGRRAFARLPKETKLIYYDDFENNILLKYPNNLAHPNYKHMNARFVSRSGPSRFFGLKDPVSGKIILSIKNEGGTPLIGLSENFFGGGLGGVPEVSATAEPLLNASNDLRSMRFKGDILDPSPEQKKKIFEKAASAVNKMAEFGGFSPQSAAEILQMLDSSARAILDDPSSPYHGKGYTEKDLVAITTNNLLGTKSRNELLSKIKEGLQICISRYNLAGANLAVSSDTGPFKGLLFQSQALSESAARDYDTLLSYGSILFDIKAPEIDQSFDLEEEARKNPAQWILWTAGIAAAIAATYFVYNEILRRDKEEKKELHEGQKSAVESAVSVLNRGLSTNTGTIAELDALFEQVKGSGFPIQLIKGDVTTQLVNCQGALRTGYRKAVTFDDKKNQLISMRNCLVAQGEALGVTVKQIEKQIEDLKKRDPLQMLLNFFANTFETATNVAKIALYAALGLGAVWGGIKVYKSINSDDA